MKTAITFEKNNKEQFDLNKLSKELLSASSEFLKNKEQTESVINDLRKVIKYHDYRYYVMNDPVISDYEYDQLYFLLKESEDKYPELITGDSPTQRISYQITKEFPKVKHFTPMLSLDNSYNEKDLIEFDKRIKSVIRQNEIEYTIEPKFDGAGISLIYDHDKLIRGATRGDGVAGEEITHNLKVLRSIPLSAEFSKFGIQKIEIRGEVLMRKETLKELNRDRINKKLIPFANPRNAAAGSLRLQDSKLVAQRKLEAFVYQISYAVDKNNKDLLEETLTKHQHCIEILDKLGFNSPFKNLKIVRDIHEALVFCNEQEKLREDLPYEIDGLVIKVNNLNNCKALGYTSRHPKWALAFKFKARQGTTKLIDVQFHVGRTGTITPVAKLEPVSVGGVVITSASLHNEDFIKERDIHYKDTVLIERAGDVIPYIVKPIKEARSPQAKKINFPAHCPSCNSILIKEDGETSWKCLNINCSGQILERLIHFSYAMDIAGLGVRTISLFYNQGLIKAIPDIFNLPFNKIKGMPGFGDKAISNLQNAIEDAKHRALYRLIYGLGIRYVGENTALLLSKAINDLSDLYKYDFEKLKSLQGIGPIAAKAIYDFFHTPENVRTIEALKSLGVNITVSKDSKESGKKLSGLTFSFTGALENYARKEAQSMIEQMGGEIKNAVSSSLNYLIAGKNPGSKLAKARENHIKILNEEEFMKLLKN